MSQSRRRKDDKLIALMRPIARQLGWAVAVHGTRSKKDLDLIACPWTPEARPIREVVKAWTSGISGFYVHVNADGDRSFESNKPHGRVAVLFAKFPFPGRTVDVSFMPRVEPAVHQESKP